MSVTEPLLIDKMPRFLISNEINTAPGSNKTAAIILLLPTFGTKKVTRRAQNSPIERKYDFLVSGVN